MFATFHLSLFVPLQAGGDDMAPCLPLWFGARVCWWAHCANSPCCFSWLPPGSEHCVVLECVGIVLLLAFPQYYKVFVRMPACEKEVSLISRLFFGLVH